jgi:PEP-CTERM motif-containing protein
LIQLSVNITDSPDTTSLGAGDEKDVFINAYGDNLNRVPFSAAFTGNWDYALFLADPFSGSGDFRGAFHLDVNYDGAQGYAWNVGLKAFANGTYADGETNFGSTTRLLSVTLPDGTPLDEVTFDSGLVLGAQPVPEPSSFCIAAAALVFAGLRRFLQSHSTAC